MLQRLQASAALVPLLTLLLCALAPAAMHAQTPAPVPERPPGAATLRGEVRTVNPLTIRIDGQDRTFQTAPDVVVTRDGKRVTLDDLKEGDLVSFSTNPDNAVQRLDLTETETDARLWVLSGVLVLLLVAATVALWYLTQQRRGRDRREPERGTPRSTHR